MNAINNFTKLLVSNNVLKQVNKATLKKTAVAFESTDRDRFRSPIQSPSKNQFARYGGRHTVTALPGDGIGPEMIDIVRKIFAFANVPVDFEECQLDSKPSSPESDLDYAIMSIQRNGVAIKGNIETKYDDPIFKSRNVELRRRLDLFANVLHCVSIPTIPTRHKGINIVMIRENTEGEYSGHEHETVHGVVESLKICTREKLERISRFAFDYAIAHNRKKVTAVHKANIQKLADGLFLKVVGEIAEKEYPSITFDSMIVDNASMQLVSRPQQFDIMLMPNLYGNIISNIACGLVGGPGLVSGMNIGDKYAVFETGTRNTGSGIAGQDIANPTAFIRAGVDMLHYLGLNEYANLISDALFDAIVTKRLHTKDIGGTAKTSDVVNAVMRNIESFSKSENYDIKY
ncbi:Isocitrate dehydrogenase [NAD] subunit gamma, mitochondrial [Strongyloides ratti]|uniref:Isocitrate dehydrogenase [NAD] subunit, mitochondrial n=1 Tax=Strongyloides ratti TaxID=34506 RepID=A0A090LTB1_STRRB|nr:Isocitrate dehydrogenase [NAD] subunit gamma, mitochondrial [Strongyloides ratti]CEF71457.1 Isocitrate dehydrogenase [NAD] subunit gamma, mitochondrial [Strongyloides ratti]